MSTTSIVVIRSGARVRYGALFSISGKYLLVLHSLRNISVDALADLCCHRHRSLSHHHARRFTATTTRNSAAATDICANRLSTICTNLDSFVRLRSTASSPTPSIFSLRCAPPHLVTLLCRVSSSWYVPPPPSRPPRPPPPPSCSSTTMLTYSCLLVGPIPKCALPR